MRVEMVANVMAEMEDDDQCGAVWLRMAKLYETLKRPKRQVDRQGLRGRQISERSVDRSYGYVQKYDVELEEPAGANEP